MYMYKKNANMQSDVNGLGRAESLEISFIKWNCDVHTCIHAITYYMYNYYIITCQLIL